LRTYVRIEKLVSVANLGKQSGKILIGAAFKAEISGLREHFKSKGSGRTELVFEHLITGMGQENVRRVLPAENICEYDIILNIGTAGSLRVEYEPLQILFPHTYYTEVGAELLKIPAIWPTISEQFPTWKSGALFTSSEPVTSAVMRQVIFQKSRAEAVDMEAFAYAALCQRNNIPFYCLKVITDQADSNTAIDFKTNLEKAVVLLTENARQLLDFLLKQFYTKAEIKNG